MDYGNMPYINPGYPPAPVYSPYGHCVPYWACAPVYPCPGGRRQTIPLRDYGPEPFVFNIEEATLQNDAFRTALWTGEHLQLTLMSLKPGEDIGIESHPNLDQFIRIEQGQGLVMMGDREDHLHWRQRVSGDDAIIIPAGTWHNLINTGCAPLKLYSLYAPPQHPFGTVHETREDAEENHRH